MAGDQNGKRLDDDDAAGWWKGLSIWLQQTCLPPYFFGGQREDKK